MKLGQYKGISVKQINVSVSDQDVMQALKKKQKKFSVVIHTDQGESISEYQALDDEFARDFSEYDTLDAWKTVIREELTLRRETSVWRRQCKSLLSAVIADSEIFIDPQICRELTEELYEDFLYNLEEHNMTLENYCRRSGLSEQQIRQRKKQEAARAIQEQSVLHAVADREQIAVSEEELRWELFEIAGEEEEDPEEFLASLDEEELESIADQIRMDKAMELIRQFAVFVCTEEG